MNMTIIVNEMIHQLIWVKSFFRNYGLYVLLESQWIRLQVPYVLRIFWLIRLSEQAVFLILSQSSLNGKEESLFTSPLTIWNVLSFVTINSESLLTNTKYLMVRGCETVIAVLGMTSILSGLSHQIGCFMQAFLAVEDQDDRSIGTVSAILFFILALQNGLTSMEPEKRFMRLYRNFCLLFTAILHFVHNMVHPLLFTLSASRNMSISRHLRALAVCLLLFVVPISFLFYLWSHHTLSTWLLAVTAFSIEVIIKVSALLFEAVLQLTEYFKL